MKRKPRLILLGLSLVILVVIGYQATGSFAFLLHQFWFTAGLFLLVLLSLVDQPHFSGDANIFLNGATAWVSLLLVPAPSRSALWWSFFAWATYLIISSLVLMWVRSRDLRQESGVVQVISRVNRQIGRPEAIFSAFFLWGCFLQFDSLSRSLNALFLFWSIFMIVNLPAVAIAMESLFSKAKTTPSLGVIEALVSPRVAEAKLLAEASPEIIGKQVTISRHGSIIGTAVIIDDRIVAGERIGRLAVTDMKAQWSVISNDSQSSATLALVDQKEETDDVILSVADVGSEIGKLVFHAHPNLTLESGEVVWTQMNSTTKAFYQIVSGQVFQTPAGEGNIIQSVKVSAGQLGIWERKKCRFEPVTWVPPAGELVHKATAGSTEHEIPKGQVVVGKVPNSEFPVHVNIEDAVTHNTALIGVTGSGKSYLAFHLIEAMVANGIKVMILDLSRQHYVFLNALKPTPLKKHTDVATWLAGDSLLGVHQYAETTSYPLTTSQFVEAAFNELSKTTLQPGRNEPARLCIVLEEAHSLIPEWNQVALEGDKQHVNKTARIILQGRKFGMGSLIIAQRTANVTKTILNQCNTIFALQSFDQTGLEFLKNYMGEEYSHAISTLPARRAILVGKASSSARPIMLEIDNFLTRWQAPANASEPPQAKDAKKVESVTEPITPLSGDESVRPGVVPAEGHRESKDESEIAE